MTDAHISPAPEPTTNQLLFQIFTQIGDIKGSIGTIEGRLAVGSERHREFAQSLDTIDARTSIIEAEITKVAPMSLAVEDMKPKVKDLVEFKGRMAAILLVASTIVGAAFAFIWEGIRFFAPDIRPYFDRFFH
jgi:hypothetical protein